jgi:PAS domain S-box-containing protein
MASATVGVTSLCLAGMADWTSFGYLWRGWWFGDAIGVLVVTPFLLVWIKQGQSHWQSRRVVEAILSLAVLVGITGLVFTRPVDSPLLNTYRLAYIVIPIIVWFTFRFGPYGATTASLVVTAIAVWSTGQGLGPFALDSTNDLFLSLQTYLAIVTITALILTGALTERVQAAEALEEDRARLRQMVEAGTTELLNVNGQLRQEISERKRAEEALQESQEMLQLIMDNIPFAIFWKNKDLLYLGCNREFAEDAGLDSPDEVIGKNDFDLPWIDQAERYRVDDQLVVKTGMPKLNYEEPQTTPVGEQLWLRTSKVPLHDAAGQVVAVLGMYEDITERKQAEEALRQRNRELAMLNQASRALTSTLELDQVLRTVLKEVHRLPDVLACSIWLIDPETSELVCREVTDPQARLVRGWRLAPGQGLAGWVVQHKQSLNVRDVHADERHFKGVDLRTGLKLRSILTVPLQVKQEVIGVMQVVDEQPGRFAETHQTLLESLASTAAISIQNAQLYEQARQDAETKLALFHEVNHRVKNNLTAIMGLLYAERHHTTMEERTFQDIINTLINRVQGLATVHELLSASEWRPLPLSELAAQIIRAALQILSSTQQVSTDVQPSPIEVSPTQANHLALIINELATNSIKYALSERDRAKITVYITQDENTINFEFRDNGPGFPEDVLRLERHNVGLYLIQTMVESGLQGELSLQNDNGAVTVIRFKMMQ